MQQLPPCFVTAGRGAATRARGFPGVSGAGSRTRARAALSAGKPVLPLTAPPRPEWHPGVSPDADDAPNSLLTWICFPLPPPSHLPAPPGPSRRSLVPGPPRAPEGSPGVLYQPCSSGQPRFLPLPHPSPRPGRPAPAAGTLPRPALCQNAGFSHKLTSPPGFL